MRRHKSEIPAEPLRRHMVAWLERQGQQDAVDNDMRMSPHRMFCEIMWPDTDWKCSYRNLHRILHEAQTVSFDQADKIVCSVLETPWIWHSDPELSAAYQAAELRTLDATRPTCAKVEQATSRKVVAKYKKTGTMGATSAATGIAIGRIKAILQAAA